MRSKFFMLAIAALLAASMPAQAVLTLEFWLGGANSQSTTATTGGTPSSILGLRQWSFTGATQIVGPLNLTVGDVRNIRAVLRDHDPGAGYSLDAFGLQSFAFSFGYVPGQLQGTRDTTANSAAPTATVWAGTTLGNGSTTISGPTQENAPFAIANFDATHFTLGNLFGGAVFTGATFQDGAGDWLYPLANLRLDAVGAGAGTLTMSKPTTTPPTFGNSEASHSSTSDAGVIG
jgi:hypothetical protein